jgi:hypothetical protein
MTPKPRLSEFVLRFGTRRSVVQIHSPRPLFNNPNRRWFAPLTRRSVATFLRRCAACPEPAAAGRAASLSRAKPRERRFDSARSMRPDVLAGTRSALCAPDGSAELDLPAVAFLLHGSPLTGSPAFPSLGRKSGGLCKVDTPPGGGFLYRVENASVVCFE